MTPCFDAAPKLAFHDVCLPGLAMAMRELGDSERPEYTFCMLANWLIQALHVAIDVGAHLDLQIPAAAPFGAGEPRARIGRFVAGAGRTVQMPPGRICKGPPLRAMSSGRRNKSGRSTRTAPAG